MLIGREKEIIALNERLQSNSSELIAVYGRRRVGKTFLIRECYKRNTVFEITGYYRGSMRDQLRNFHSQLKKNNRRIQTRPIPKDWFTAFELLESYLDNLRKPDKKVVFIDEFPWLATTRSKFLTAFEHFWNTYCTKRDDLVVVICGSAASFMVNKIIRNKGGLHNRITCKIPLRPFNLFETEKYLKSKKIELTHFDIIQLYMTIGGIPYYLDKIRRGESVAQNIDRLCFADDGELVNEFHDVFVSLFSNSLAHENMIRVLAKSMGGSGLERAFFASRLKFSRVRWLVTPVSASRRARYLIARRMSSVISTARSTSSGPERSISSSRVSPSMNSIEK